MTFIYAVPLNVFIKIFTLIKYLPIFQALYSSKHVKGSIFTSAPEFWLLAFQRRQL